MSDYNWREKLRELGFQGLQITHLDILAYDYAQARIISVGQARERIIAVVQEHPDFSLEQINKEVYKK